MYIKIIIRVGLAIDVNMSLDCNSVVNDLRERLSRLINENYVAVLLFGSWARCEADESDVDILVLHRGLNKINKLKRSKAIYLAITALLKDCPRVHGVGYGLQGVHKPRHNTAPTPEYLLGCRNPPR